MESSAIRVAGLACGIDHQPFLGQAVDQALDVVAQVRALVAGWRVLTISSSERSRSHSSRTAAAVGLSRTAPSGTSSRCSSRVVDCAARGDEPGATQASDPGGCVSPRSIASSCAPSIYRRLGRRRRPPALLASGRSTVRSSAYCASRGACTAAGSARARRSIHSAVPLSASSTRSQPARETGEDATDSIHGYRAKLT